MSSNSITQQPLHYSNIQHCTTNSTTTQYSFICYCNCAVQSISFVLLFWSSLFRCSICQLSIPVPQAYTADYAAERCLSICLNLTLWHRNSQHRKSD